MMRFELGLESLIRTRVDQRYHYRRRLRGGRVCSARALYIDARPTNRTVYFNRRDARGMFIFGFIKGRFTGTRPMRSALQTALIGSLAAGAAF